MNQERKTKDRLCGCYVTDPILFRRPDVDLNLWGMEQYVKFLIQGSIRESIGVLLGAAAAGKFSTLSLSETIQATKTVVKAADGQVPWLSMPRLPVPAN